METSRSAAEQNSAARAALNDNQKEAFKITGALQTDLTEVCDKLNMSEPQAVAFGLGILLKAIDEKGEIHIINNQGKTVYRSKRMG